MFVLLAMEHVRRTSRGRAPVPVMPKRREQRLSCEVLVKRLQSRPADNWQLVPSNSFQRLLLSAQAKGLCSFLRHDLRSDIRELNSARPELQLKFTMDLSRTQETPRSAASCSQTVLTSLHGHGRKTTILDWFRLVSLVADRA